jgi:sugar lactone lactonase YvrE
VADRLSNSVYRYSETGDLIGTVLTDNENINQATGVALSLDRTNLYVSSFQNGRVMKYDYDYATGTATNPMIFASDLEAPSSILFAEDGDTIFVSNFGGLGVSRFNLDGSSAGAPLQFPPPAMTGGTEYRTFSGLTFAPNGNLLVGVFLDYPASQNGAVGQWDGDGTTLEFLVDPHTSQQGASGLLVNGDHLYVSGMFAGNIQRFNLADGERDPSFSITGLGFPQGLATAPTGGFLAGILGFANGQGRIAHYDLDGNLVGDGVFASAGATGGFTEATSLFVVPDRLAGDFNNDGSVDAADYTVWRNNLGGSYHLHGNGDETGASRQLIDLADYELWKLNYGSIAAGSGVESVSSQVPEPASIVLAVGLGVGYLVHGQRRRTTRNDPK